MLLPFQGNRSMARFLILFFCMRTQAASSRNPDNGLNKEEYVSLYYKEISKTKPLSPEEEAALARRIRQNDRQALNQLIRANLRFVVSVCRNYRNQGLPLCDLINEGNLGLIRAAWRFDETRQFKFISYAVWRVRQSILQALSEQSRLIKPPSSRIVALNRIHKSAAKLDQNLGRTATPREISLDLDLQLRSVETSVEMGLGALSLDAPTSKNDDSGLLELLSNGVENGPDQTLEITQRNEDVSQALQRLRPKEEAVLKMYFGIDPEVPHSLEEIG